MSRNGDSKAIGVAIDISANRVGQQGLAESRKELAAQGDAAINAIITIDFGQHIAGDEND
ncbi:MAG TPA: hypothetical protein VJ576_18750 [Rhodocyclaceae bacterium]|nr:hypothetical protein [Rhodocyclaceae bacterium]